MALEQYEKAIRDFRSVYRYEKNCGRHSTTEPQAKTDGEWQKIFEAIMSETASLCPICNSNFLPGDTRFATLYWFKHMHGFVITIGDGSDATLKLPMICGLCNGSLFRNNRHLGRTVNPDWKQSVAEFILPELAELLYDYVFPDPYCPLC